MTTKTGRNDPCPCGSGKKYKHCCLGAGRSTPAPDSPGSVASGLFAELEDREFESEEELQAALDELVNRRNRAPLEEFDGLSPDQMRKLMDRPFDAPDVVRISSRLSEEPEAPILGLFRRLAEAIGEKGLKSTATGNLPRKFCQEAFADHAMIARPLKWSKYVKVRSEPDYLDLHITRLVAELAGLVRKYGGRFILSREAHALIRDTGYREIYPRLFKVYAEKFNWAYRDRFDELPIVQTSFAFTLYLLQRHGHRWQPQAFYEDALIRAFPAAVREVPDRDWSSPESTVRHCFRFRALENFAEFLGLVEIDRQSDDVVDEKYLVRSKPLLDRMVAFTDHRSDHPAGYRGH